MKNLADEDIQTLLTALMLLKLMTNPTSNERKRIQKLSDLFKAEINTREHSELYKGVKL